MAGCLGNKWRGSIVYFISTLYLSVAAAYKLSLYFRIECAPVLTPSLIGYTILIVRSGSDQYSHWLWLIARILCCIGSILMQDYSHSLVMSTVFLTSVVLISKVDWRKLQYNQTEKDKKSSLIVYLSPETVFKIVETF